MDTITVSLQAYSILCGLAGFGILGIIMSVISIIVLLSEL